MLILRVFHFLCALRVLLCVLCVPLCVLCVILCALCVNINNEIVCNYRTCCIRTDEKESYDQIYIHLIGIIHFFCNHGPNTNQLRSKMERS